MMTTLQIVLAIVGIGMIAIIVIYNLVQERRFRKEADRLFSHKRDDIILGEAVRTDPSRRQGEARIQLTGEEAQAQEARTAIEVADAAEFTPAAGTREERLPFTESEEDRVPPLVSEPQRVSTEKPDTASPAPRLKLPPTQAEPLEEGDYGYLPPPAAAFVRTSEAAAPQVARSPLDAQTEYIARLKFASPVVTTFSGLLNGLRRIGKPVRAFGLRADGIWEVMSSSPRGAYSQMELGLQLADRSGALAQDQLDLFCRSLYTFAADAGGAVTCPEKEEALVRARDLDLFCMNVDVLMGLNVVASEGHPFTSEAIHTQATAAGLVIERDGIYHAHDAGGHSLFTLANQEETPFPQDGRGLTTQGVTLLFDVPRVADGVNVFDRMTEFGFRLADRLSGRLVDDNGRVVSGESLGRDRARLQEFYDRMQQRDIPAGGERAMRLFA